MNINMGALTLRDYIWMIGAAATVVGSWVVLGQDVQAVKQALVKQELVDSRQNQDAKDQRQELILLINRTTDEIKQEVRDLRQDIRKR